MKKTPEEPKKFSSETIEAAKIEVDKLVEKGYDRDYLWRYAKAAKSWCEKGSADHLMWEFVVQQMAPQE